MDDEVRTYMAATAPEERAAVRRAAEQRLTTALGTWLALVHAAPDAPTVLSHEHQPAYPWQHAQSYWAFALFIGLILYGIGIPILLDSSPEIDLRIAWAAPAIWPLDLLAEPGFGVVAIVAGLGMLAEALRLLRPPLWRIIAWHLALYLIGNVAAFAGIAMWHATYTNAGRPLTTFVTFTALAVLIVLRIYGGAGFYRRVPKG